MAAASIANIVKSSLGPVGLDKMLVDDIGVSVTCNSICSFHQYCILDGKLLWHELLICVCGLVDRTWPSPTTEQPSWSCWRWSTRLPRSCVNWRTCRTRRSEMGPHLWWVGSSQLLLMLWRGERTASGETEVVSLLWEGSCNVLFLVPCICLLLRMCGYANRREKLSVSVWRGWAASLLPPLMKRWYNVEPVTFFFY